MATWIDFVLDTLLGLEMPQTGSNEDALLAIAGEENTSALNNLFATTEWAAGATTFNSVGVKDYPTMAEGVAATVATLKNGLYESVLDALHVGTDSMAVVNAWVSSRWGTGRGAINVLRQVVDNYESYAQRLVSGSEVTPVPPAPEPNLRPCSELTGNPPADYPVLELKTPYMVGAFVRTCQQSLKNAGYGVANSIKANGQFDGVYGPSTASAVRLLQQNMGLTVDGIVGVQTWCALGVR